MKLQLITIEQAQTITEKSKAQVETWITDGELVTYNDLIVAGSLKAMLQKDLLEDIEFKFGTHIHKHQKLSRQYKQIKKLETVTKTDAQKVSITPNNGDGPKANLLVILGILGTLAYAIFSIFG